MPTQHTEVLNNYEFEMTEKIRHYEKRLEEKRSELKQVERQQKEIIEEPPNPRDLTMFIYGEMGLFIVLLSLVGRWSWIITGIGLVFLVKPIRYIIEKFQTKGNLGMQLKSSLLRPDKRHLRREILSLSEKKAEATKRYNRYCRELENKVGFERKTISHHNDIETLVGYNNRYVGLGEEDGKISRCILCYQEIRDGNFYQYQCCGVDIHLVHIEHSLNYQKCPYCKKQSQITI